MAKGKVFGPELPPAMKKARRAAQRAAKPSLALKKAVNQIISRKSETKQAGFYGTSGVYPQTGAYADRNYSTQNATVTTVAGDVKMLLPYIQQGTEDWQRVGNKIQPLTLKIHGTVKIAQSQTLPPNFSPTDLFAVQWILTSKTWKSYQALLNLDLTRLLKTQEGSTVAYDGTVWGSRLELAEEDFSQISKRVIRLRYAGIVAGGGGTNSSSIANSHDYVYNYTITMNQKKLPATLLYPEQGSTVPAPYANQPTNYAPFMIMGFYKADGSAIGPTGTVLLENTYTTIMKYKDM